MKLTAFAALAATLCLGGIRAEAQSNGYGPHVFVPDTSIHRPQDAGKFAHTNHLIMLDPANGSGPGGSMLPSNLQTYYSMPSGGGAGIIAIVDAFDHPNALSDFNAFSSRLDINLPTESSTNATNTKNNVFQVVYQGGKKPRRNTGWAQEIALDIEWAHAMAPNAKILLVEAQSNSFANLFAAVDLASNYVDGNGKKTKAVSMSWSSGEFSGETSYDVHFPATNGVLYFASTGDTGGLIGYPSCSPNVVGVGGTTLNTDSSHALSSETGWSGSGGGHSAFETKPTYQTGLSVPSRSVPDISSDADPNTGVLVVYNGGLYIFGGTSVSSPCIAGMVNAGGGTYSGTLQLLSAIYTNLGSSNFRDIISGSAGSFSCVTGWDYVTGVGSSLGTGGFQ